MSRLEIIYVIYRAGGQYRENCARVVVSTGPRAVLKTEGTVFPYTDRPKQVNNIFFFPTLASLQVNLEKLSELA